MSLAHNATGQSIAGPQEQRCVTHVDTMLYLIWLALATSGKVNMLVRCNYTLTSIDDAEAASSLYSHSSSYPPWGFV